MDVQEILQAPIRSQAPPQQMVTEWSHTDPTGEKPEDQNELTGGTAQAAYPGSSAILLEVLLGPGDAPHLGRWWEATLLPRA